jgi:hypothetical protein
VAVKPIISNTYGVTETMFEKPWNLAAYCLTLLLLILGAFLRTNITAIVAIMIFVGWDASYLLSKVSMRGRTIDMALQQTQNIREHISYFLAFYGVLFAILFTQSFERQSQFLEVCGNAGIPISLLVLPFVLALIPLLFFPIQLAKSNDNAASASLKALVSLSAFFQKVSIFLFAHIILRILHTLTTAVA